MHVVLRHCYQSEASKRKARPSTFSREGLFQEFLDSSRFSFQDIHVMLDCPIDKYHFVEDTYDVKFNLHKFQGGNERASFLYCLEFVKAQEWDPNDVVVFLEDDYKVSRSWDYYVKDGLQFADYVSLYDHPDKYSNLYQDLNVKLYKGACHWRTTPSTTNSYACKVGTLLKDFDTHAKYSLGAGITNDHLKFLNLWQDGRTLITSIPAHWSHEEDGMQCVI